ncbi:MAG: type II secretion system protein [Clostridia bacterium]|nr:type II secretion system protein [Clostridia bacterium]
MLMSNKLKSVKSKRAFTLIELVVVIAVLGVLAAIAIPVITTSINAAKISTMESNAATVEMLLKEAVNTSKASMTTVYNNQRVINATVEDVLIQNNIDLEVMSVQRIGKLDYAIYWDNTAQGTSLHTGTNMSAYNIKTKVASLDN